MSRPQRKLDVWTVFERTFSAWSRNIGAVSVVALAAYVPVLLFLLWPRAEQTSDKLASLVDTSLTLLASEIASGAVTFGVIEHFRGRRAAIGTMLGGAAERVQDIITVAIVSTLAIGVGLVLLLVPGIYLGVALSVAVPAAVVERKGLLASLERSWNLTSDQLAPIFGALLAVNALHGVAVYALQRTAQALALFSPLLGVVVSQLAVVVFMGLPAVASAVIYHDLRVLKEGTDTSELAKVFE